MWIQSKKNNEWINLEHVVRISMDGQGGYIAVMTDGGKCSLSSEDFEEGKKLMEQQKLDKHHKETKDFDIRKEIDEIKKALGVKTKEGEE